MCRSRSPERCDVYKWLRGRGVEASVSSLMVSCVSKPAIYDVTPIYLIASGCNVNHGIQSLRLLLLLSLLTLSAQLVVVLRTYVNPRKLLLRDYQVSVEESQLLSLGL